MITREKQQALQSEQCLSDSYNATLSSLVTSWDERGQTFAKKQSEADVIQ